MKKALMVSVLSACCSLAHAGTMGESCCSAFMSVEGGYTVNNLKGYSFTVTGSPIMLTSIKNNNGYSGRLALGMIGMMDDQIGISGELGWGYYGRTTFTPSFSASAYQLPGSLSNRYTLSGFDALVGINFVQTYFNLYLKAGALIQNMQIKSTDDYTPYDGIDSIISEQSTGAVLPEIKLGAAYTITDNWAITASYLVAFGSTSKITGNYDPNAAATTLRINNQNPTINAVLIGIQYTV